MRCKESKAMERTAKDNAVERVERVESTRRRAWIFSNIHYTPHP